MSFNLVNSTGWTTGDLLTEEQINQLDSDHAKAVDGTGGGNYTLLGPLTFGGDTVTIQSLVAPTINGNTTFSGETTFEDNASFSELVTFSEDIRCYGEVETQKLQVNFLSQFDGDVTFNAPVEVANTLSYSGAGRTLETGIVTNDADQSIDITQFRHIHIPTSTTGSRTYTLTGAVEDGDWVCIHNNDTGTHAIAGLFSIPNLPSGRSIKYLRIAGTWRIMSDSGA